MKNWLKIIGLVSAISLTSAAHGMQVPADGYVSYKMPSGEIVDRAVTLLVPPMGIGDVVLRGQNGESVAERFFTREINQRKVFYVTFDEFPGAREGEVVVFRGTYMRGSNAALYYGDVYKVTSFEGSDDDLNELFGFGGDQVSHLGGFMFKAER